MEIYASPRMPRWVPSSEADIRTAIDGGELEESHYLDMKREVGDTKAQRKETARDLASFAIDGGTLLVGLDEDSKQGRWNLMPQPREGLAERIEQVAASVVDPPLFVTTELIESEPDPTKVYALVQVPPSATAPHMVDGAYYGRGDKTKRRLTDPEVLRLHARRDSAETAGMRLLAEEIARDPVGADANGHLYLIAQPQSAARDVALGFLRRAEGRDLFDLVQSQESKIPRSIRDFAPSADEATNSTRRAMGIAMCSHASTGPGRSLANGANPHRLLDIEFRQDSGIRVLVGRMTVELEHGWVIADGLAVAYACRLVHWAASLGEKAGFRAAWTLGVAATGLRGLQGGHYYNNPGSAGGSYFDADDYREVTTATHLELTRSPGSVAERLVGRLVRALRTEQLYQDVLTTPASSKLTDTADD